MLLQFKIAVFCCNTFKNVINSCDGKAEFSEAITLISCDPSEIILIYRFAAHETFLIIINVKNSCAAYYFCGNCDTFFQNSVMYRKFKK